MSDIEEQRNHARSQQQQAIYAQAPVFIRACPGAGKTRTLVHRHCNTPPGPRRSGRALLSFTNVAADELRHRCTGEANRADLTAYPHYIGTFDSFLWRYLVRPHLPATPVWQHILSWDHIPSARVRPRDIPLSSFEFSYDPTTSQTSVQWPKAATYLQNSTLTESDYLARAKATRERLWQGNGYMTGLEVRIAALEHASDPSCIELLKHRFFEIVVDEAQDCSALDLLILTRLHQAGVPLVIVADTDQGIYEWNDARPEELHTFTQHIPDQLELTGNWRSSAAICRLAATLRPPDRTTPDVAVGEYHDDSIPLLLLPYGRHRKEISHFTDVSGAGEAFTAWAATWSIGVDNCLALAYMNSAVPKARTQPLPDYPKEPNTTALAWAATVFTAADASTSARTHALSIATTFLREHWYSGEPGTLNELLTQHNLTAALFRRRAASFLAALPPTDHTPARDWRKAARKILQSQAAPTSTHGQLPAASLIPLSTSELDEPISRLIGVIPHQGNVPLGPTIRSSSIHRAKGSQAQAVLVHLPKAQDINELVTAWTASDTSTATSELLRTYYVAFTRAQRLLSLTYPYSKHADITRLLQSNRIEYQMETTLPQDRPFLF
ncbi:MULTISPECIES: UvrD-helicase domain-containing protein [unclassified Streptomyces]|uniref:UvrD-helicase domain-containing protein n=1 Tax=unclassified Streptomyces TaxID=2593676 RepID=UPI000828AF70|nr:MULTISPECIES: UvrD-helicase domain-containing protein [unclassified Streptomyces]OCC10939.1 DNA helicase II [Streptomyces sp. PTY087I2]UCA51092.1 UvrD-helicase domain-containing protein [Streptomyces sp. WA6-1-16]UCA51121.1 UvrD-helicase domain-containing protein [Streptomyces sp. WA6-1-16]WSI60677.1 UvrD-helicase domain-containing protein [Streptomyces sp. NBC_01336]